MQSTCENRIYAKTFSENNSSNVGFSLLPNGLFWRTSDTSLIPVTIEIANPPHVRYTRQISFSVIDFIITAGGVFGIFFGITFLAVVELGFVCLRRSP